MHFCESWCRRVRQNNGVVMRFWNVQAMLAVGAGGLAVNAVKGILGGGGDDSHAESSKQDKISSKGSDEISRALESLSKSGAQSQLLLAGGCDYAYCLTCGCSMTLPATKPICLILCLLQCLELCLVLGIGDACSFVTQMRSTCLCAPNSGAC